MEEKVIIGPNDTLPFLPDRINNLYKDYETSSGDPKKFSTNPWHNCEAIGACITWDDYPRAYYIDRNHPRFTQYIKDLMGKSNHWINHNIKYDMHVVKNSLKLDIPESLEIVDTLTSAKIIDSDRRSYDLGSLSKDWCGEDISEYETRMSPYLRHPSGIYYNRDYGKIPIDIIGPYGAQDVITERKLHAYIEEKMPVNCRRVYETEKRLTRILFDMEQIGMKLDMEKTVLDTFKVLPSKLRELEGRLHEKTGKYVNISSSNELYDLLHIQLGLPILEYTENDQPSFGKRALSIYSRCTFVDRELIEIIREYKKIDKLYNSFARSYLELQVNGYLHGSINQAVRTGRMSMNNPNMQQLSKSAKRYIIAEENCYIISIDLSQIEYRWITHYCKDERGIEAYKQNPETDYHTWVAEMTGLDRSAAKTVNFLSGYGGGVQKLAEQLEEHEDFYPVISNLAEFQKYCKSSAKSYMTQYHENLPNLKRTMYAASSVLKRRGFIRNALGRDRHMPTRIYSEKKKRWFDISYKAFNNASQSSAADLMKEKTVLISDYIKDTGIKLIGLVHDDWIFYCPKEELSAMSKVREIINQPLENIDFSVPILCEMKKSEGSWADVD